jgi:DNA-binding transcriptional MerR regulator
MNFDGPFSIGTLSKLAGVKVVTIRYYEQIDLMPAPSRTKKNYRSYDTGDLHRLQFIRRCRDLGFPTNQLRDLLRLSAHLEKDCSTVDHIAEKHLATIEQKIADLRSLAAELRRIKSQCPGNGVIADCRILEALFPSRTPVTVKK